MTKQPGNREGSVSPKRGRLRPGPTTLPPNRPLSGKLGSNGGADVPLSPTSCRSLGRARPVSSRLRGERHRARLWELIPRCTRNPTTRLPASLHRTGPVERFQTDRPRVHSPAPPPPAKCRPTQVPWKGRAAWDPVCCLRRGHCTPEEQTLSP